MNAVSKVAVVTGGGRGIGRGITRALAGAGYAVIVGYSADEKHALEAVREVEAMGGHARAVGGDIGQKETAQQLVDAALRHFGRLDGWVNNAGVLVTRPLLEISEQDATDCYRVNFLGSLFGIQAAAGHFTTVGGGVIVNVGSEVGLRAWPLYGAYSPSKFAQAGLTQVASLELGPLGIRVNCVAPGMVETDMVAEKWAIESRLTGKSVAEIRAGVESYTSLGTLSTPDDIGQAVAWLLGPHARNVSGQTLVVNGGGPTLN